MNDCTTIEKIRRINDCFRRSMVFGGSILLNSGVSSRIEVPRLAGSTANRFVVIAITCGKLIATGCDL